ncbi:MAG: uridine kinase [Candidatus Sulfomarinibacteraceae bacterium]
MAGSVLVIGVAGGTGSGKTTVADEIIRRIGAHRLVLVHQDRYYRDLGHLEPEQRARRNFDHPDAIEESLMIEHLGLLRSGSRAPLPVYDFARHLRTREVDWVEPRQVILVEGILVLAVAGLRRLMDIKLYVDTDPDIRFIRRMNRDLTERGRTTASVVDQWLETVRPMHLEWVEPSKRFADLIIPEGGLNTVALDLIISRIEQQLASA